MIKLGPSPSCQRCCNILPRVWKQSESLPQEPREHQETTQLRAESVIHLYQIHSATLREKSENLLVFLLFSNTLLLSGVHGPLLTSSSTILL